MGGEEYRQPFVGYLLRATPDPLTPELRWSGSATRLFPGTVALHLDETGIVRRTVVLERDGRANRDDEAPLPRETLWGLSSSCSLP